MFLRNDSADFNNQYFRPSKLPALNINNFGIDFFDKYSNEDVNNINLPNWLFISPKDTIINYFSILREASDISKGGCGTIGNSKFPYPIAYNFFTTKYKNTLSFESFLQSFKDIGHINLINLHNVTEPNSSEGTFKFFIEIETIEPSIKGNTAFAYYYGYVYIKNENGKHKIFDIDLRGEDFLCAPYHGWQHNAESYIDITYGDWCDLIKKRYPTKQSGYIKNIYIDGKDGKKYLFQFFQLTNGTDIEVHKFVKDSFNQWHPITLDPYKCLKRWNCGLTLQEIE